MGESTEAVMTQEQVCEWLGIRKSKLHQLCKEEGLPHVRLSWTQRVFLEKSVIAWLRDREKRKGVSDAESE